MEGRIGKEREGVKGEEREVKKEVKEIKSGRLVQGGLRTKRWKEEKENRGREERKKREREGRGLR